MLTKNLAALVVAVFAFPLAACGGDDSSSSTAAPAETLSGVAGPTDPGAVATPTSTGSPDVPATGTPSSESSYIEVDLEDGAPATAEVALGTPVTIHVTSDDEHEFHLHGYDIELTGDDVTFDFSADKAGVFELETHDTEELVLTLTVAPE